MWEILSCKAECHDAFYSIPYGFNRQKQGGGPLNPRRTGECPNQASGVERCETGGEAVPLAPERSAALGPQGLRRGTHGEIRGYCRCQKGTQS